ncbi:MAG: SPOR domain-containing protein [Thermodesulfobacteriota bacterium]
MAKKRRARKKKFTVRFELGLRGLVGLAIISFCVFLWMFLLGVWAGQTVLLPSDKGDTSRAISRFSSKIWSQGQEATNRQKKAFESRSAARKSTANQNSDEEEASYFTLQVAAYDSDDDARQEVLDWQARGEDSFFLKPQEGYSLFRVFLGRYDTLAAANEKVDQLEEAENLQAFITLLPVAEHQ